MWMILIGTFLRGASATSYQQLVEEHGLTRHGRYYPVMAGEELLGLVTLEDIRHHQRADWPKTTVFRAMTPFERLRAISPEENVMNALRVMGEADVHQVPVVEGRRLLGIISRGDIVRLIQIRRETAFEG